MTFFPVDQNSGKFTDAASIKGAVMMTLCFLNWSVQLFDLRSPTGHRRRCREDKYWFHSFFLLIFFGEIEFERNLSLDAVDNSDSLSGRHRWGNARYLNKQFILSIEQSIEDKSAFLIDQS